MSSTETRPRTRELRNVVTPTLMVHNGIFPAGAADDDLPLGTLCTRTINTTDLFGRGGVSGARYFVQTTAPVTCSKCIAKARGGR